MYARAAQPQRASREKTMRYIGNSIIKNGSIEPSGEQDPIGKDNEVYEVLRIDSGHALFLQDHLTRWANSMRATGRSVPDWTEKLPQLIDWLIICNGIANCDLRVTAADDGSVQCGFLETEFPTAEQYSDGVACQLLQAERPDPGLKIFHSSMRSAAAKQQKETGAYESLLVNANGLITEGSRSNVYFVDSDGQIHTAPDGTVLGGIMRMKVIEACGDQPGIPLVFECVKAADVSSFKAAFLSSTPMRVLPISKIGDVEFDPKNKTVRRVIDGVAKLVEKQINSK